MQRAVSEFVSHVTRYRARHESAIVFGAGAREFLPLDVDGALIPSAVDAPCVFSPATCEVFDTGALASLARDASLAHGALTVEFDKGLVTRGLRLFYVNGYHADSELRARAPDEDYVSAPPGTLRGPFVVRSTRTERVLVGDFVRYDDGRIASLDEVCDDAPVATSVFDRDPLARMHSAFHWLMFMKESGIPKVFWLISVVTGAIALMGMDHDDGKCSLHTDVYASVHELMDDMRDYVARKQAVGSDATLFTFGEYSFYRRRWSLFYPSIATPVISVDCNTEALDWCVCDIVAHPLPDTMDPFHRELVKCSSRINVDMLAYERSIAQTQARLAGVSDAPELDDDDDMVRGGVSDHGNAHRAPNEIVNTWVDDAAVDAAMRHDKLTQTQEPIKYDIRNIEDQQSAVLYTDILRILPRMIDAFDAFAATHTEWSDVQVRERIIDMNSDFVHFANGRFTLVQHLLKRDRDENLLRMTLSVTEACAALQDHFHHKTHDLDVHDPEERDEFDAARADFEREVDREIQNGWVTHGFHDSVWLNHEMVRDLNAAASR